MPYRLTKLYTRTGDTGYTNMGDLKVSKDDLLIESIGTVDELNSAIGMIAATPSLRKDVDACLIQIQNDLFDLGGELYLPENPAISAEKVTWLEQQLDNWNDTLPPLAEFILPRGSQSAAASHLARAICRRAERCLVRQHRQSPLSNPEILRYLNRLSDLLFVIARLLARESNDQEPQWKK